MKAVQLYAKGDLRIEEVEAPDAIESDEVLLSVEAAGICGSDLHNFHTGVWISRSPSIPGHEFCARVLKVGERVTTLQPGDRVVADSRVSCGDCDACNSEQRYLCAGMGFVGEVNNGGFAAYTVQKASQLLKLPSSDLPAMVAVFAEPLAVALHAVNRVNPRKGDRALIVGAGTIGVLCAIVLRHRGIDALQVAELNELRRNHVCEKFGMTAFELSKNTVPNRQKPTICIDTTGSAAVLDRVLENLSRGGRLSIVGLYRDNVSIDMNAVVEGGITLCGCAAFDNELHESVSLLPELREEIMKIAVQEIDIESVPSWYDTLSKGDSPMQKIIIQH
ncbi:MAG: zinc-binding dehydrogenase [Granulosicoccus sp.]